MSEQGQNGRRSVPSVPPHPYHYEYARWKFWHWHMHRATARGISIFLAVILDAILCILLGPLHHVQLHTADGATWFCMTFFVVIVVYAIAQFWTLSKQTGSGLETAASVDLFFSITPLFVTIVFFAGWFVSGRYTGTTLDMAGVVMLIAVGIAAFSAADFLATTVTNMRLRSLQMQLRPAGT